MMEDSSYPEAPAAPTSSFRWAVFGLALILGVIGLVGVGIYYPVELATILLVFYIPMIVFLLWATYRWAQGREIAPTDVADDERIFSSMRKHAVPVHFVPGTDYLQCPDCQQRFNLVNALPAVDEIDVVLCPNCGTRLHVQGF